MLRVSPVCVRSTEDVFTALEDNQVKLSTMKASRFVKAFEQDVDRWERVLSHIMEVVELLLTVQRQWMYLEVSPFPLPPSTAPFPLPSSAPSDSGCTSRSAPSPSLHPQPHFPFPPALPATVDVPRGQPLLPPSIHSPISPSLQHSQ